MKNTDPQMTLIRWAVQVDPPSEPPPLHNVHWKKLYQQARHHRILPLLYTRLKNAKNSPVDPDKLEPMKRVHTINSRHNIRLAQQLIRVINLFSRHNIDTVPFKGPVLAEMAYGDLSLRVFNDLDLFIHPGDFLKVYRLLQQNGFSPEFPDSRTMRTFLKRTRRDFLFGKESLRLDIHQQIIRGPKKFLPPEEWFRDRRKIKILSCEVGVFRMETFLVALCMHAARHSWEPMMLVADIAFLIHRYPRIDWEKTNTIAGEMGCLRILLIGLGLSAAICGLRLPEVIMSKIYRDVRVKKKISHLAGHLLNDDHHIDDLEMFLAIPGTLDSMWLRLKYLLFYMWYPRPSEIAFHKHPAKLLAFWPIIQPLRLLFKMAPNRVRKWFKF